MSAMNTFTGRIFDPLKMTKKDVCVEDIAHALSLVCRGGRTYPIFLFGGTAFNELCR